MYANYNYFNDGSYRSDVLIISRIQQLRRLNELVVKTAKKTVITINNTIIRNDYSSFTYNRVWNNSEATLGGRIYNSITNMPSLERHGIYFNGLPVIELDYSCFVVRSLYHLEGLDIEGDIYSYRSSHNRDYLKKAINILINCSKDDSPVFVLSETTGDYNLALDIIKEIMINHKPIKKYFYSGIGLKAQVWESEISIRVLTDMLMLGYMCCNIHDCCLIPINYMTECYNSMISNYKYVLGVKFNPVINIKR